LSSLDIVLVHRIGMGEPLVVHVCTATEIARLAHFLADDVLIEEVKDLAWLGDGLEQVLALERPPYASPL
jgi:hypothetical protein